MGHLAHLRAAAGRQKIVDDPLLNRMGLQVARTVAAHAAVGLRARHRPAEPIVAEWAQGLRADGCLVVADFLPPDDFVAVETAARVAMASEVARDEFRDGANTIEIVWRRDVDDATRRSLDRFFHHPRVLALAAAAERTDVTDDDGPLIYHAGSNHLSLRALRGVYRDSLTGSDGSRRVDAEEFRARARSERIMRCRANTLVFADTFGYHGRVQGRPPGCRLALQIEFRPHPFGRHRSMAEDLSSAQTAVLQVPHVRP